jgi:hypothetical protein
MPRTPIAAMVAKMLADGIPHGVIVQAVISRSAVIGALLARICGVEHNIIVLMMQLSETNESVARAIVTPKRGRTK